MYYKMSLFLARYKKYVSPLFNPQHENGCVNYYFFGLTEYGASQKGLCPLVFGYFCRVTKVPLHEVAAGGIKCGNRIVSIKKEGLPTLW